MSQKELIRKETDGTLSFGDYSLLQKGKKSDFEYQGDLYKVKTYSEITKLERNGMFVYESVPGTDVSAFCMTENGLSFLVRVPGDVQLILGLEEDARYKVYIREVDTGEMETQMGGKLVLSLEAAAGETIPVKVEKR